MSRYSAYAGAETDDFINECMVPTYRGYLTARELWDAYLWWYDATSRPGPMLTKQALGRSLHQRVPFMHTSRGNATLGYALDLSHIPPPS